MADGVAPIAVGATAGFSAVQPLATTVRRAATELPEQVPLGPHDVNAAEISVLKHSQGEFRK